MSLLHVVMVGCGRFARLYHVPALADPSVRLHAFVEPAPGEEAMALARRFGAPVVPAIADVPAAEGQVACIVSTPHALHAAHAAAALDRGWHVLCDKPFVLKLADGGVGESRHVVEPRKASAAHHDDVQQAHAKRAFSPGAGV